MSPTCRGALLVVAGVGTLAALAVPSPRAAAPEGGQRPALAEEPDGEPTPARFAVTLPTDPKVKQKFEAVRDYQKSQSWAVVVRLLQDLLDAREDHFVQVQGRGLFGPKAPRWVGARAEARRLLGTLPARGLVFYEVQSGPRARTLLARAKEETSGDLLAEVARRYFHTRAGAEAADLLGTWHLDRGEV